MQGQVFVPYTGIGGFNMNMGIMPMAMEGSTYPPYEDIVTLRIFWTYPGGINMTPLGGQGFWGYSVYTMNSNLGYSYDTTIKNWLLGDAKGAYVYPEISITEEMIEDEDPLVIDQINYLMQKYAKRLMDTNLSEGSDLITFEQTFVNCWEVTG